MMKRKGKGSIDWVVELMTTFILFFNVSKIKIDHPCDNTVYWNKQSFVIPSLTTSSITS